MFLRGVNHTSHPDCEGGFTVVQWFKPTDRLFSNQMLTVSGGHFGSSTLPTVFFHCHTHNHTHTSGKISCSRISQTPLPDVCRPFSIRKPPVIIKMFYFQGVLRLSPRCFIFVYSHRTTTDIGLKTSYHVGIRS